MPELEDETNRPKKRLDPNWVLALCAVGISFMALWVSLYEVSIMRQEERAQVWPYLDLSLSYSGDGFAIVARNKGTGPALVGNISLELKEREYTDWLPLLDDVLGSDHGVTYATLRVSDISGEVMSPEEELDLFAHPWTQPIRRLSEIIPEGKLKACYCSIYDECWSVVGDKRAVTESCPGAPVSQPR
ncbi:MAG: hypothetical protein QNJ40_05120 [Xanthomonadales bacterium]|nr:hypothetical protein [Xanthomonadales bacterium]